MYTPNIQHGPRFGIIDGGLIFATALGGILGGLFGIAWPVLALREVMANKKERIPNKAKALLNCAKFGQIQIESVRQATTPARKELQMTIRLGDEKYWFTALQGELSDNKFFGGNQRNVTHYNLSRADGKVQVEWTERNGTPIDPEEPQTIFKGKDSLGKEFVHKNQPLPQACQDLFVLLKQLAETAKADKGNHLPSESAVFLKHEDDILTTDSQATPAFEVEPEAAKAPAHKAKSLEARA